MIIDVLNFYQLLSFKTKTEKMEGSHNTENPIHFKQVLVNIVVSLGLE